MLRLSFHLRNRYLRVRELRPEEDASFQWKGQIEFAYSQSDAFTMSWASLLPDLTPEDARSVVDLVSARYPVSPDFLQLKRICPELIFPETDEEWVFYGGSFNPWHEGHQACLSLLPQDKTCFVLPDRSPHKEIVAQDPALQVLELITRIRFNKKQYLVPSFLMDMGKNPTVEWMERLRGLYPQKKLSLLIGFDSFKNILNWTRASELLSLTTCLYVVSRLEKDEDRLEQEEKIRKVSQNLGIVFLGRHEFEASSSTKIREKQGGR